MIKAIIFDLDDTLYNERDFVVGGFKEVCKYLSEKYDLGYEEILYKTIEILESYGRGKIFNIICKQYNLNENVNDLVEMYRNAKVKLNLYDDSRYILNELKGKYKLGLITDGMAKVQWRKIEALDIKEDFDKIIVTDDFGREYWKPHVFAYQEMLRNFTCFPQEAIYIGDNPHKDFIGAKQLGFKTIRIIREHGDYMKAQLEEDFEANYIVNDLRFILNYLI